MMKHLYLYLATRRHVGQVAGIGRVISGGIAGGVVVRVSLLGITTGDADGDAVHWPWASVESVLMGNALTARFAERCASMADRERKSSAPTPALSEDEIAEMLQRFATEAVS